MKQINILTIDSKRGRASLPWSMPSVGGGIPWQASCTAIPTCASSLQSVHPAPLLYFCLRNLRNFRCLTTWQLGDADPPQKTTPKTANSGWYKVPPARTSPDWDPSPVTSGFAPPPALKSVRSDIQQQLSACESHLRQLQAPLSSGKRPPIYRVGSRVVLTHGRSGIIKWLGKLKSKYQQSEVCKGLSRTFTLLRLHVVSKPWSIHRSILTSIGNGRDCSWWPPDG